MNCGRCGRLCPGHPPTLVYRLRGSWPECAHVGGLCGLSMQRLAGWVMQWRRWSGPASSTAHSCWDEICSSMQRPQVLPPFLLQLLLLLPGPLSLICCYCPHARSRCLLS